MTEVATAQKENHSPAAHSTQLNELSATAICGNDISSSCLYVSALAIVYAGKYAWISLLSSALAIQTRRAGWCAFDHLIQV
jgi:hypothetical protein